VALELGRIAVGVDLSPNYFSEVVHSLLKEGYEIVNWEVLKNALEQTPGGLTKWRGNKVNFRKPRQGGA
jgi:hypothetical protein